MAATRTAEVSWSGTLIDGKGTIDQVSSGAFAGLPVTWASRTEAADGRTSPEELLAAAHAACYAMAFSGALARNETPATSLNVSAAVTFDKVDTGWKVVSSALTVHGVVPGIDAATFTSLAEATRDGCPISGAIKGNVALSVKATLEG